MAKYVNSNRDLESPEYKIWRFSVLSRDGFKCVLCPSKKNLEAHHIKRWVDAPKLRFMQSNGVTLCQDCHTRVTNNEKTYEDQFTQYVLQKKITRTEKKFGKKNTKAAQNKAKILSKYKPPNPRVR